MITSNIGKDNKKTTIEDGKIIFGRNDIESWQDFRIESIDGVFTITNDGYGSPIPTCIKIQDDIISMDTDSNSLFLGDRGIYTNALRYQFDVGDINSKDTVMSFDYENGTYIGGSPITIGIDSLSSSLTDIYTPLKKSLTIKDLTIGANKMSQEELGTTYKNLTLENKKVLEMSRDYIKLNFGNSSRTISFDSNNTYVGYGNQDITFADILNFNNDVRVKKSIRSVNNNNSYISFPDSYNVEFGTQSGGNSKLQIRLKGDGNTINGNTFNHSITMQGTGYILGLNSENSSDGIGKGQILGAKFITNSSKSMKTDIENIDLSNAVEDILSITPKSFLYKGEKEQYDKWIETGKSNDEAESFDRTVLSNKHIGFLAEDFVLYDSLKPFITSILDKNDNETVAGIDYGQLTPLLLAVCQKQQKEINSLKVQLSDLQEKFNDFLISMKG